MNNNSYFPIFEICQKDKSRRIIVHGLIRRKGSLLIYIFLNLLFSWILNWKHKQKVAKKVHQKKKKKSSTKQLTLHTKKLSFSILSQHNKMSIQMQRRMNQSFAFLSSMPTILWISLKCAEKKHVPTCWPFNPQLSFMRASTLCPII